MSSFLESNAHQPHPRSTHVSTAEKLANQIRLSIRSTHVRPPIFVKSHRTWIVYILSFTQQPVPRMSYYHGLISSRQAVAVLSKSINDGCFLIRDSQSHPGQFVLSVRYIISIPPKGNTFYFTVSIDTMTIYTTC